MVAFELLANIPDGIEATALIKLIDGDDVSKVQHVDLFQLRRGAELGCHDVQGHIAVVHDFGIALANSTCFQDDQIKPGDAQDIQSFGHVLGEGEVGLARGQRTHVDPFVVDGVHPNAVAEECAACLALGGVHADQANAFIRKCREEATDQFVDHGRLASPTGPGDSQHGNLRYLGVRRSECFLEPI